MFDIRGWLLWLLITAVLITLLRNPLYSIILLLVSQMVKMVCIRDDVTWQFSIWRFGVVVLIFSTLFNMLLIHIGNTILFTFPSNWWLIGGVVTLEAAVYGFSNGLLLLALLSVFMTFNAVIQISELARLTPRALRDLGIVVLIAMTYMPQTMQQLQRIREAQAIRGHQLRGLRDWQPIVIPLLVGGLERAMNLAEAMVARGYGATTDKRPSVWVQIGLLLGLLVGLVGWFVAVWWGWPGWILLATGVLLMLFLVRRLGQRAPHTHYNPRHWTKWDTLLVVTAVLPLLFIFLMTDPAALSYSPYPQVHLPPFHPTVGISLLFLIFPAVREYL